MKALSFQAISLNDLQAQNDAVCDELTEVVADITASARFTGGMVLDAFAEEFAEYCGVKNAVPCHSGTEALRLAILGVLGEGDGESEIITVSHTFPSTLEAIIAARYKPVLVDVDPDTHLMDLECVEAAFTKRTVAVVPVYTYGQMVDIVRLRKWTTARHVAVIEDAGHAVGAAFDGVSPGGMSEAAAFHLDPTSNLGAWGEAGAVVCRDATVATRIAQYIDHGRSDPFTHVRVGCGARLDAIQAAVLRVKLRHLDDWNKARQRIAGWYGPSLEQVALHGQTHSRSGSQDSHPDWTQSLPEACKSNNEPDISTPQTTPGAFHVFNQYVIQTTERDRVRSALGEADIATGVHYPIPAHEQPAYRFLGLRPDDLPVTHRLCKRILSLPMFPQLSREQANRVVEHILPAVVSGAV